MPNIETIIKSIFQQISDPASQGTTYSATLDLKYAYIQLNIDPETANKTNLYPETANQTNLYPETAKQHNKRRYDRQIPVSNWFL